MITLDQVLLLQKKVETAVEKIKGLTSEVEQLKADNDALRSKCAELTKALTDKSEFVSTLESEQDKIESTILHALNQLDIVENSILNGGSDVQEQLPQQTSPDSTEGSGDESGESSEENVIDYSSASKGTQGETDLIEQESEAMKSSEATQQGLHNAAEAYAQQSTSVEQPESAGGASLFDTAQNPPEQKTSINSEFDIF